MTPGAPTAWKGIMPPMMASLTFLMTSSLVTYCRRDFGSMLPIRSTISVAFMPCMRPSNGTTNGEKM